VRNILPFTNGLDSAGVLQRYWGTFFLLLNNSRIKFENVVVIIGGKSRAGLGVNWSLLEEISDKSKPRAGPEHAFLIRNGVPQFVIERRFPKGAAPRGRSIGCKSQIASTFIFPPFLAMRSASFRQKKTGNERRRRELFSLKIKELSDIMMGLGVPRTRLSTQMAAVEEAILLISRLTSPVHLLPSIIYFSHQRRCSCTSPNIGAP